MIDFPGSYVLYIKETFKISEYVVICTCKVGNRVWCIHLSQITIAYFSQRRITTKIIPKRTYMETLIGMYIKTFHMNLLADSRPWTGGIIWVRGILWASLHYTPGYKLG